MTQRLLRAVLAVGLALGLATVSGVTAPISAADPQHGPAADFLDPVVVVMDTSGSMSDADASGTPRIEGARSAVLGLVDALPPKSQFALIAYPADGRVVDGCSTGAVEVPLGELDQATTAAAVRRLTPDGDTPTGPALQHAAQLIKGGPTGKGTVVLVSDGESNCGATDVCTVAKQLSSQGVEIQVNTVGFQVNEEGKAELTCIAKNAGGRYVDAKDKHQLEQALQDLSGARLTLDATVPNPLPVVSGTGAEGPKAVVTVTNQGRKDANDVRVSLDFRDDKDQPGAVLVPRPVRFLGNLAPGDTRRIEVTVRPDASQVNKQFTWTAVVTATNAAPQRVDQKTKTAEPKLDGLLAGVKNIAVLGDSYSSGEGAGDYDDDGTRCDRSAHAYGRVLTQGTKPPAETTLIACSGAVTADFYTAQEKFGQPQLTQLRQVALSDRSPDAVLLSIGGNDVDFSGTVKACALGLPGQTCAWLGPANEATFVADAFKRIAALGDSLRRVYRDVNRVVNDSAARDHRDNRYAPIIVVPYPRITPAMQAGAQAANGCFIGISAKEVEFFNRFIDMLNLEIAWVAVMLRSKQHVPIYVATDVISAFQPNHTICDKDSYANTTTDASDAAFHNRELLHPNKAGNAAMARAISIFAAGKTLMTDPAEVTWTDIDTKKPVFQAPLSLGALGLAGADVPVNADGFVPDSTVVFRLNSTPRTLGSATSTGAGSVSTRVELPADIRPGRHELHALGLSPDGQMRDVVVPIRVVPPQTVGALIGLVIGVAALLVGGIGMWLNRRRRTAG